jgi:hypothetical protein
MHRHRSTSGSGCGKCGGVLRDRRRSGIEFGKDRKVPRATGGKESNVCTKPVCTKPGEPHGMLAVLGVHAREIHTSIVA